MSVIVPGVAVQEPHTIGGHPSVPLLDEVGDVKQMLTVCCDCGAIRSIIMLVGDRWYCSACRTEGNVRGARMFPVT